jgi:cation/acetate symporter
LSNRTRWGIGVLLALLSFFGGFVLFARAQISSLNIGLVVLSVGVYAAIGFSCRTTHPADYFVAGRAVSPLANGLATAADWMSAASFIGLTGILMMLGFTGDGVSSGGLVYMLGWTGGFVILATVFAGRINSYGVYTLPELLEKRFGSVALRRIAAIGAFLCSGVYLVAQIYGIGLVTSLLSGMTFELGVFLALGGVLLCSFLGGMRAVTWTQLVQCYVIVGVMLVVALSASWKLYGHPVATLGASMSLSMVQERAQQIQNDPAEAQVKSLLHRLQEQVDVSPEVLPKYDSSWLTPSATRARQVFSAEQLREIERNEVQERMRRPIGYTGSEGADDAHRHQKWINGVALVLCLMLGTASLPHVAVRSLTTSSPAAASRSIVWALALVVVVYVCACSLAIMAKGIMLQDLVGARYDDLPAWVNQLRFKKLGLLQLNDVNHDGIVQFAEIGVFSDYLILGVPEIIGLPSYFLGLLAVGAMAAALSTADGLLLTISNALTHDAYYTGKRSAVNPVRKVMVSKILLLMVALVATWIAAHKSVNILSWVSHAFSLAAGSFFPVLLLGLCTRRATAGCAVVSMLAGLATTLLYMGFASGLLGEPVRVWGIESAAAGLFGVCAGLVCGGLGCVTKPQSAT